MKALQPEKLEKTKREKSVYDEMKRKRNNNAIEMAANNMGQKRRILSSWHIVQSKYAAPRKKNRTTTEKIIT